MAPIPNLSSYARGTAAYKASKRKRKACTYGFPMATRARSRLLNTPQRDEAAAQRVSTRNSSISPLLRLPLELRLLIYSLAFEDDNIVMIYFEPEKYKYRMVENKRRRMRLSGGFSHELGSFPDGIIPQSLVIGLLYTCRQTYNEAASLPYARNTFVFDCEDCMRRFFRRLQAPQKAAIARFIVMLVARPTNRPFFTEWKYKGKGLVNARSVYYPFSRA